MSLLDGLRAAIAPSIAARSGYLAGEEQKRQRQRNESIQDEQRKQNNILAQIRADLERSQIEENRAQSRWYDERNRTGAGEPVVPTVDAQGNLVYTRRSEAAGKRAPEGVIATQDDEGNATYTRRSQAPGQRRARTTSTAPHTRVRDDGMMMQYDPETDSWFETGMKARDTRGGASNPARLNAQAALNAATKAIPRPSKVPNPPAVIAQTNDKGKLQFVPNPVKRKEDTPEYKAAVTDSTKYENDVLGPLRKNLYDVTVPGLLDDNTPDQGLGKSGAAAGAASSAGSPPESHKTEAAALYAEAAEAYKRSVAAGMKESDARARYDRAVKRIAEIYGDGSQYNIKP